MLLSMLWNWIFSVESLWATLELLAQNTHWNNIPYSQTGCVHFCQFMLCARYVFCKYSFWFNFTSICVANTINIAPRRLYAKCGGCVFEFACVLQKPQWGSQLHLLLNLFTIIKSHSQITCYKDVVSS